MICISTTSYKNDENNHAVFLSVLVYTENLIKTITDKRLIHYLL